MKDDKDRIVSCVEQWRNGGGSIFSLLKLRTWGIICLSVAFVWQLYTLWLLIQLHESEDGTRYSRYLGLSMAAFGERLGKVLSLFPIMYLSGGTCVTLIMVGGGSLKTFFHLATHYTTTLTTVEGYLVFTCSAILLAQLPNLNSIAGVSFIGAITAVGYSTLIWALSISKGRPIGVTYGPAQQLGSSPAAHLCNILNALGIIAFSFRGHNLVLEIQGTMQTSKTPSRLPMWLAVKSSYLIIGSCIFPLAIAGYWTYGNSIHGSGGLLNALYEHHGQDTSKALLCLISLLVVINSLTSFQIYAMPVFDNFELRYTSNANKACPRWVRTSLRILFGCIAFFISVSMPFLPTLAGLIGGLALPVTLAYPCLMWIKLKKPSQWSTMWWLNWGLGFLGLMLSVLLVVGAVWRIVTMGMSVHFFKP
ncbi:hypothetical protein V2J09_018065 [Rumex salicifolius]